MRLDKNDIGMENISVMSIQEKETCTIYNR